MYSDVVRQWAERVVLPIGDPNWRRFDQIAIQEGEADLPGLATALRTYALQTVAGSDTTLVKKALAVLAITGREGDVAHLRGVAVTKPLLLEHIDDVVRAIRLRDDVRHRARPARSVSPLRDRIGRAVVAVMGVGACTVGIVIAVMGHGLAHRVIAPIVGLAFGLWLFSFVRTRGVADDDEQGL